MAAAKAGSKPKAARKPRAPQPKPFPQGSAAGEALLQSIGAWLRGRQPSPLGAPGRAGKPTHNHDICRAFGISIDQPGAGRLYAAMKARPESFIFRPDNLPAAFKAAPKGKRS